MEKARRSDASRRRVGSSSGMGRSEGTGSCGLRIFRTRSRDGVVRGWVFRDGDDALKLERERERVR